MSAVDDLIAFWESNDSDEIAFLKSIQQRWNGRRGTDLGFGLHRQGWDVHMELGPVPYMGDLQNSRILLLMLNPSVSPHDYLTHESEKFSARLKQTIEQTEASPCLALDDRFGLTSWFLWYEARFRGVCLDVATQLSRDYREVLRSLADNTAILELFPYYANDGSKLPLPTINQFAAVRKARRAAEELTCSSGTFKRTVIMWWARQHWNLKCPESSYHYIGGRRRLEDNQPAYMDVRQSLVSFLSADTRDHVGT